MIKPRRFRKGMLIASVVLLATYCAVLVWFRLNEDRLLFHPDRGKVAAAPAALELDSHDVAFTSSDSTPLTARVIPPPATVPAATAAWILYLHGASGNVGTAGYNEAWAKFRHMGLGVLAVDYRGFGASGGKPSEAGLYRDAYAAYAYLTRDLGVTPSRIVIYGYSLGSAVAIDLAARVAASGLIVEGSLLSVPIRAAELYPYFPVARLARNRFASLEKVAGVSMPKLFVHARGDTDIPIAHGRKLFDLARAPKFFQEVAGDHTSAYRVDPGFFVAIERFVVGLGLPVAREGGPR